MHPELPAHSLNDLARLADVTVRTVRYYIAQGLLPSAEAAGPATRYGEGHLARLRVIKWMQAAHLPLAEIRARIETVSDEDLIRLAESGALDVSESVPSGSRSALDYVHRVMDETGARTPAGETGARTPPGDMLGLWPAASMRDSRPRFASTDPASPQATQRTTWERVPLAPDIELHLRRPLDRATNKRVDRLLRAAREIFDGER